MASMILASAGWGVWWLTLVLAKLAPNWAPNHLATYIVSCSFAGVGLVLALFTVRAKLIWILLTLVPLLANGSLLVLPSILGKVGSFELLED